MRNRLLHTVMLLSLGSLVMGQTMVSSYNYKADKNNGKYQWLLKPKSDYMAWYSENDEVFIMREGDKWGIIDKNTEVLVQPSFKTNHPYFDDGLCYVEIRGHWMYINRHGEVIIETPYEINKNLPHFRENLVNVKHNTYYGYMNRTGHLVIDFKYKYGKKFSGGLAAVRNERDKWGYIDTTGEYAVPAQFDAAMDFHDGYAYVTMGREKFYIDRKGKRMLHLKNGAGSFSEGLAPIKVGLKWGFMNTEGHAVAGPYYDAVEDFHEGMAQVTLKDKVGFINKSGELIIPVVYQKHPSSFFKEGLAFVKKDGIGGYIDKSGTPFTKFGFTSGTQFAGGVATVQVDGKWGAIELLEPAPELDPEEVVPLEGPKNIEIDNSILCGGHVYDVDHHEPIEAEISFMDITKGEMVGLAKSDDETGAYSFKDLQRNDQYIVYVKAPGYLNQSDTITTKDGAFRRNFYMATYKVNETVQLHNVLFVRGKAKLTEGSFEELNLLAQMLHDNPTMKIELSGHTDNQGDPDLNVRLSHERVQTVKEYLISKGVQTKRLLGRGYGGSMPIAPNDSEDNRSKNRRVEFRITE